MQPLPPDPNGMTDPTPAAADLQGVVTPDVDLAPAAVSVSSITPRIFSSAGGTQLTVNGTGFQKGAQVIIDNVAAATVRVSDTRLTVTTPARKYAFGPVSLRVINTDGTQVTAANNIQPTIFSSALRFPARTDFSVASTPNAVALGDIDGDGRLDMIVPNQGSNTFQYLQNMGGGTFVRAIAGYNYGTPYANPYHVVLADFNKDNRLDVAVAHLTSGGFGLFTQNANNTFAGSVYNFAPGSSQYSAAAADFNNDGYPDVVLSNSNAVLYVLMNNQNSTFTNYQNPGSSSTTYRVIAGDFTGDGKPDAVTVVNPNGQPTLNLFSGTGNTNSPFNSAVGYGTNNSNQGPQWLEQGDFNNDGKPDIVVSDVNTYTVRVFLGNATAANTFQNPMSFPVGINPYGLAVADINGDGNQDILVANGNSTYPSLTILRGDGTGMAFARTDVATPPGITPFGVAVGRLDEDQKPDLVMTQQNGGAVSVFLNLSE